MTKWGRHGLAASLLAAMLGTACSGSGGASSTARRHALESHPSVAPRPRSTATSATTAPRPTVVDGGSDPVAVARSLLMYGRRLEAHDPDPALVERAYASGSALAREITAAVTELRTERKRIVEIDDAPLDIETVSDAGNVVSLRVTEHLARRELRDETDRVLRRVGPATEQYLVSVMRFAPAGPWRLSVIEPISPPVEVRL